MRIILTSIPTWIVHTTTRIAYHVVREKPFTSDPSSSSFPFIVHCHRTPSSLIVIIIIILHMIICDYYLYLMWSHLGCGVLFGVSPSPSWVWFDLFDWFGSVSVIKSGEWFSLWYFLNVIPLNYGVWREWSSSNHRSVVFFYLFYFSELFNEIHLTPTNIICAFLRHHWTGLDNVAAVWPVIQSTELIMKANTISSLLNCSRSSRNSRNWRQMALKSVSSSRFAFEMALAFSTSDNNNRSKSITSSIIEIRTQSSRFLLNSLQLMIPLESLENVSIVSFW